MPTRTAEYTRQQRATRRARGLCYFCPRKSERGKVLCVKHAEYNRQVYHRRKIGVPQ